MKINDATYSCFVLFCVAITAGLIWLATAIDRVQCYRSYAQFSPEYVGIITGCMIIVDGQRVPAQSLRITTK